MFLVGQRCGLGADFLETKCACLHDAATDALAADKADLILLGQLLVAIDALDSKANAVRNDVASEVTERDRRRRGSDGPAIAGDV